jgi:hypothetical protein
VTEQVIMIISYKICKPIHKKVFIEKHFLKTDWTKILERQILLTYCVNRRYKIKVFYINNFQEHEKHRKDHYHNKVGPFNSSNLTQVHAFTCNKSFFFLRMISLYTQQLVCSMCSWIATKYGHFWRTRRIMHTLNLLLIFGS